jgi:signal peptidase I
MPNVWFLASLPFLIALIRFAVFPFKVSCCSMEVTLLPGDRILAVRSGLWRVLYGLGSIPGRVVVLRHPLNPSMYVIKRCIKVVLEDSGSSDRPAAGVLRDQLVVVGDNPSHSIDSRHWGTIDARLLLGIGWLIYFSSDLTAPQSKLSGGIRWSRICRILEPRETQLSQ